MDSNVKTNVRNISSPVKTFFTEMQELNIPVNNLTLRYQQGKTEEILYREDEYLFAVTTLNCRHKNNLAITGEKWRRENGLYSLSGQIYRKTLPEYSLAEVMYSSLLAGCAFRGEFEKKLTRVIEAAISCKAVVIF